MGKTVIKEESFPEIVSRYNTGGKTEAYAFLRSEYHIKHPYFLIKRIRECGKYTYDPETDRFKIPETSEAEGVFMDLDELCAAPAVRVPSGTEEANRSRPAELEKWVHELISDRLLMLSRYITLDSASRTILIDRTSLETDGYQIVSH